MNSLAKPRFTNRLRLEPINDKLTQDLWFVFQDDDVAKWYGGKWTKEKATSEATSIREAWVKPNGVHKWMAYDKNTNEIIGRGGLSVVNIEGRDELELGWAVRKKYQGQGYASEIGRAGLDLAFNELSADYVIAYTEPHNARSRAVMERLGFKYIREMDYKGEHFVLYQLNKADYEKNLKSV
jgi:ribosomal-protein-alanine N-acetyltransferase